MRRRIYFLSCASCLLLMGVFECAQAARAQNAGPSASARVFPGIGPDLKAIKRDSEGRYYILAKPASVIWVYGADGKLVTQFPNTRSGGAAIQYAEDFDLDSSGDLYVADRGANAVEIFSADGTLLKRIRVFAPISVAALTGGQFAVLSLRSKYLVSIFDQSGSVYSEFGDRSEINPSALPGALADLGRIYGDSAGNIYFAFTSMAEPMVRKYDRVGYMEYAAALPAAEFAPDSSKPEDRLEFGLNFGQMNISDQLGAWASLGSSGTVRFGSTVGTGFGQRFGRGFMGPAGGPMAGGFGSSPGIAQPGAMGLPGATFSGEGVVQDGEFHFSLGAALGRGRLSRRGSPASGDQAQSGQGQASLLQFDSGVLNWAGDDNSDDAAIDANAALSDADANGILNSPGTPMDADAADPDATAFVNPDFNPGLNPGLGPGLQPGMLAGGMMFRPHGGGLGGFGGPRAGGGFPGRGFSGARFAPSGFAGNGAAPGNEGPTGRPGFGAPGHFVFNTYNVVGSVRVNLDRPTRTNEENPKLTAVGVDPATGESWAAIGSQLVHLASDGSLLGSYYMATPNGTPLHPDAILVESDRILIADDPLGIFSFTRPDHAGAPSPNLAAKTSGEHASH